MMTSSEMTSNYYVHVRRNILVARRKPEGIVHYEEKNGQLALVCRECQDNQHFEEYRNER